MNSPSLAHNLSAAPVAIGSLLLLLLLVAHTAEAQLDGLGAELSASYSLKPWRGADLQLGEKARWAGESLAYSQSKTSAVVQQRLLARPLSLYDLRLRVGGGYTFINRLNTSHTHYYENQHRAMLQASLAHSRGFWRFAARVRFQSTFRDESRGSYRYNPKLALRTRISATYALPDHPWKFSAHAELFYRANDPRGAFADEWRATLEATHLLNRRSSITFYGKYFQEMQVAAPQNMLCLGLRYDFAR
ncbi:MAG: hypothetical protein IJU19_06495 [Bacteroidales bacterium]|nr:hypothetical protein [Bacteroidales bacterium]